MLVLELNVRVFNLDGVLVLQVLSQHGRGQARGRTVPKSGGQCWDLLFGSLFSMFDVCFPGVPFSMKWTLPYAQPIELWYSPRSETSVVGLGLSCLKQVCPYSVGVPSSPLPEICFERGTAVVEWH